MFDYKKAKKPTSFGQSYCFTMRDINPSTMDSFNLCMEVIEWCTERFEKPSPSSSGARWDQAGYTFFFRDEEDAFQFRLRWC